MAKGSCGYCKRYTDMYFQKGGISFCSSECRNAFDKVNGGNSNSSGSSSSGSSIGTGLAAAAGGAVGGAVGSIFTAAMTTNESDVEMAKITVQEYESFINKIGSISFDGSANDISNNINELILMYQGNIPLARHENSPGKTKKQLMEKIEYGLMKCQGVNPAEADYFRKKIATMKKAKMIKTIIIASIIAVVVIGVGIYLLWEFVI